ncbi:MAG: hypothetical protein WA666_07150 [Nitrospirota bacterium]
MSIIESLQTDREGTPGQAQPRTFSFYIRFYNARFSPPENLTVSIDHGYSIYDGRKMERKILNPKESWDVFYGLATFDDLLRGLKFEYDYTNMGSDKSFKRYVDATKSESNRLNDEDFLKLIGKFPFFLSVEDSFVDQLVTILGRARYGRGKERKELKNLLRDYFLPLHAGGKKPLPAPEVLKKCYDLMGLLAGFLSEKCKGFCKEEWEWDSLDQDYIASFTKEEKRLVMAPSELKELRFSPKAFALNLLADYLEISTRKLKDMHLSAQGAN